MAIVYIPFIPPKNSPFQTVITLDAGQSYIMYVKWNLFGERWHIELYDLTGDLIFNLPLIESPLHYDISMTRGYFDTPLIYRESTNNFEVGK